MAAFELEGKITHKLELQSGQSARGPWTKQSFVMEYQDGNYPANVCFTVFGNDKVSELDKYQTGDTIKVSFNLRAREFNGRWYNDVSVWKILSSPQAAGEAEVRHAPAPASYPVTQEEAPAPTVNDIPEDNPENDLPF